MRADSIPNDVWTRIFAELLGDGTSSVILPLLSVCKNWKVGVLVFIDDLSLTEHGDQACAYPVLYRRVRVLHSAKLRALATQFMSTIGEMGSESPGRWVQSLHIAYADGSTSYVQDLLTLLMQIPMLQEFATGQPVAIGEIATIIRHYSGTLTRLDVVLNHTTPYAYALESLRHLRLLRKLVLTIQAPLPNLYTPSQPLVLPCLELLVWNATGSNHIQALYILHSALFPKLRELYLALPELQHGLTYLTPFFNNHPHIACLELAIPPQWINSFFSLPLSAHHISFKGAVPPIALGNSPSSAAVRSVGVEARLGQPAIWQFLDMLVSPGTAHSIQKVHVTLPEKFTWTSGNSSDAQPAFVGRMLNYASRLRMQGIDVIDEDGKTYRDV